VAIVRSRQRVAQARIRSLAEDLLEASTLCAIATVTPSGRAHVNTAYFAWADDLRIVWLSEPRARHSRNLGSNPSAAVSVFDSSQTWGEADRGIQLFGAARAGSDDAEAVYGRRFSQYEEAELSAYRFYELVPQRLKLFDEPSLGRGVFVTARVGSGGQVAWERTERYERTD
jgi:uncharacterized protein YhbP (UPF0306 family)